LLGAHVTVITSPAEREARVRALGADATINYRQTPEWAKATRDITGGRGYDLIVELGGEKTLPQSLRCVRPGGVLAMIGVLSGGAMSAALGLHRQGDAGHHGGNRDGLRRCARRPAPAAAGVDRVCSRSGGGDGTPARRLTVRQGVYRALRHRRSGRCLGDRVLSALQSRTTRAACHCRLRPVRIEVQA
jgi:hypothetical protein